MHGLVNVKFIDANRSLELHVTSGHSTRLCMDHTATESDIKT